MRTGSWKPGAREAASCCSSDLRRDQIPALTIPDENHRSSRVVLSVLPRLVLHPFDNDRRGHAAACAHRDEAHLKIAPF